MSKAIFFLHSILNKFICTTLLYFLFLDFLFQYSLFSLKWDPILSDFSKFFWEKTWNSHFNEFPFYRERLASPTQSHSFQMLQNVPKKLHFSSPVFIAHVFFFQTGLRNLLLDMLGSQRLVQNQTLRALALCRRGMCGSVLLVLVRFFIRESVEK